MNTQSAIVRHALFGLCIGARLVLARATGAAIGTRFAAPLAAGLLAVAAAWAYLYASGMRTTGLEVLGDRIWWNALRPVHAVMYVVAAWAVLRSSRLAPVVLYADVVLALVAFVVFHARAIVL